MNAEVLLRYFDRISDAPDAVPRLREFILDLAVRGKLVEQEAKDDPVSSVLKRIQTAARATAKSTAGSAKSPLTVAGDARFPFRVPPHWAWVPLNQLGTVTGGMTPSKNRPEYWDGTVNWFSPKDIKSDELSESELKITLSGVSETGLQLYRPGCLFMVARSGILKRTFPVAINRVEATANQDLKVLTPFINGLERYLQITVRGMTKFIIASLVKTGTTVQSLKYDEFAQQPFPLPPLAEQHRIVAKVDELMALCDRLEEAQKEREARRDRLTAASLHHLNNGAEGDDLRQHARFFINHLPKLTARPDQISQFRQTILNLAVLGKLIPQDSNDESAATCFERLRLKSSGVVESGNELPPSWTCVRFDGVADITGGVTLGRKLGSRKLVSLPYLRVANVKRGALDLSVIKEVEIPEDEIDRYSLRKNDLLMTEGGDWDKVGRTAIWNDELPVCLHQNHIFRGRMRSAEFVPRWFERYINSSVGRSYFESASKQTTNLASINMRQVRAFPIPFPPLAEQHRIVTKIDELMKLCDRLEKRLGEDELIGEKLLESVLYQSLTPIAAAAH